MTTPDPLDRLLEMRAVCESAGICLERAKASTRELGRLLRPLRLVTVGVCVSAAGIGVAGHAWWGYGFWALLGFCLGPTLVFHKAAFNVFRAHRQWIRKFRAESALLDELLAGAREIR